MRIDQNGNVGIGTTSPDFKLDVAGSIRIEGDGALLFGDTSTSPTWGIGVVGNDLAIDGTNNGDVTFINSGNVGIGTTSPLGKLQVTLPAYTSQDTNSQQAIFGVDSGYGVRVGYNETDNKGYINVLQPAVAWGSLILQQDGGNVGIGTDSPGYKLDVSGNARFTGGLVTNSSQTRDKISVWNSLGSYTIGMMSGYGYGGLGGNSTSTDYAMSFQMSNTTNRGWWWGDTGHSNLTGAMSLTTTGKAVIATSLSVGYGESTRTAATEALQVSGNAVITGNVGIGTTSPGVRLTTVTQTPSNGPLMGSGTTGGQAILASNGLYGQYSGVSNNGDVWHQVQRNDTNTASYDMLFQPSGGNVGIGTTSPNTPLEVTGGISTTSSDFVIASTGERLLLQTAPSPYSYSYIQATSAGGTLVSAALALQPDGGNVGIGTTSPLEKLEVEGTMYATPIAYAASQDAYALKMGASNNTAFDQGIKIKSSSTGQSYMSFNDRSEDALVLRGAKVGIGTDNPGAKLEISSVQPRLMLKDTTTGVTSGSTTGAIDFYTSDGSSEGNAVNAKIESYADSIYGRLGLRFFTGGAGAPTQAMTVNWAGNVGIGNTSPTGKLDVFRTDTNYAVNLADTLSRSGLVVKSSGAFDSKITFSSGASSRQYIQATNNATTTGRDICINPYGGNVGIGTTSPSYKLDVTGNGRFTSTVTATNFILSSDKRLKDNIKEIDTNHVDVNWKNFELKSEPGVKRTGVIAQELEEAHPEFVRTDDEGMKSVAYIDLLIAKIAELEARLEKLEK